MARCNCPHYNVPSADPNDSKGCPVHDPDYVDPAEATAAKYEPLVADLRAALEQAWLYGKMVNRDEFLRLMGRRTLLEMIVE